MTFETAQFIFDPTYFNGFENIGSSPNLIDDKSVYPSNTPYSEGGITVEYVGDAPNGGTEINIQSIIGGQATYGWYGPGYGYTDVKLTSGGEIQAIQFLASSGGAYGVGDLTYELLNYGSVVATGSILHGSASGDRFLSWYGFSGGGFDEVRLAVFYVVLSDPQPPPVPFSPNGFDTGVYTSFGAVPAITPLPSTWTMMLIGLEPISKVLESWESVVILSRAAESTIGGCDVDQGSAHSACAA